LSGKSLAGGEQGFGENSVGHFLQTPAVNACAIKMLFCYTLSAVKRKEVPMLNATVKKEILNQVGLLDYEQQRRVLEFAHALAITGPKGVPGKQLLSFAGTIPADDLKEMEKAIEDSCETVDLNEW